VHLLYASIPSPSSPLIVEFGPFKLRWYGTLIAIGILLAGYLAMRELRRRGHDPEVAYQIASWCVPGGIIGARLYHVATDWDRFFGHLAKIPALWEGGLGLPGVIAGGALGAAIGARRAGVPVLVAFDCIAPGLVAAQALGRFGNYFNQELFGGPTSLPWGLEIDPAHRPARYAADPTFHPTFLYESVWNLIVCLVLLQLSRRMWSRLVPGTIFAAYLALYSPVRALLESVRVDPAQMLFGVRFNQILFSAVFVASSTWFLLAWRRRRPPDAAGVEPPAAVELPLHAEADP
jgi:phosphatidylglycerol---prolipoprotein diacylglyceryl transferase